MLVGAGPVCAEPKVKVKEFQPAGPWNVHYEEETCKLRRDFVSGEDVIGLEMTKLTLGDGFQFVLIGHPIRSLSTATKFTVQFGTLPQLTAINHNGALTAGKLPVAMADFAGIKPIDPVAYKVAFEKGIAPPGVASPSDEAAVTSITIKHGKASLILHTGTMGKAFAVWRNCADDMVKSWGVDPRVIKTPSHPSGNPALWLTTNDYPSDALREYKGGLINFRLTIGPDGKPSKCSIQRAINESLFAQTTCKLLMKRARFSPALDAEGKPVASFFISSARFQIGG